MNIDSKKTLLSIAIPTKNRHKTLLITLDNMLRRMDDSVEFVICDNSDEELPSSLPLFLDKRIKYFYSSKTMSIVDNTENALSHCTGEFVCFIGDDDFVSPYIINYLKEILHTNIDAVSYQGGYYWWKDIDFNRKSYYEQAGAFWYPSATFEPRLIRADESLRALLSGGGLSVGLLPRLYHGIVRRFVLDNLKKTTGRYVHGASPDISLAVSLALLGVNTFYISTPLTIFGASKKSGGGWTAENKHYGSIREQQHIPQYTKDNWSSFLPDVWSEHTIYPQSIIEVYDSFNKECIINLDMLYASLYINEPHLRKIVTPFIIKYYKRHPNKLFFFIPALIRKKCGDIKRKFESKFKCRKFYVYHSLEVSDVMDKLEQLQTKRDTL